MSNEKQTINEKEVNTEPTTTELQKAKKALFKKVGIFLGVATVIFVVFLLFYPPFGSCIFGLALIIAPVVTIGELARYKRLFCTNCGKKYDYESDISWEETDEEIKEYDTVPSPGAKHISAKRFSTVQFKCHCQNCNTYNTFSKKYQTGTAYDDGSVKEKDIYAVVKKYFKV